MMKKSTHLSGLFFVYYGRQNVRRFCVIFSKKQALLRMEPLIDGVSEHYGTPKYAGQIMTKSDFLKWEADDAFVYEYNNGRLKPTDP